MAKKVQPATANIFSMVARPVSTIKDSEIVEALRECKGLIYLAAAKLGCTHSDLDFRVKTNDYLANLCKSERGVIVDKAEAKLVEAMESGAKERNRRPEEGRATYQYADQAFGGE